MWFVALASGMPYMLSKCWTVQNLRSKVVIVRKRITEITSDVPEKNYLGMLGWWEERVRIRLR